MSSVETDWCFLKELELELPCDPVNQLWAYTHRICILPERHVCDYCCPIHRQGDRISLDLHQLNGKGNVYTHIMGFYSATEKNGFLKFAEKCAILQITLLNETIKKTNTMYSFS